MRKITIVIWVLAAIGFCLLPVLALFAEDKPATKRLVVPQRFVIPEEFRKPTQDPDENSAPQFDQPTPTASPLLPAPRVELIVSPFTIASSPSACPLDASVIVTAMGQGRTFVCSGTCVDSANGVSTILTCAHEFRGLAKPEITVTHKKKEYPAKLSRLDDANDLAVLTVDADLPAVELATVKPGVGDEVTSIGISHADAGKLEERNHKITAVDKYSNPRNFESDGNQIVGRSGGGLFVDGSLCGIIQGRRNDIQRSIYVSIEPIRELLSKPSIVGSSRQTKIRLWMAPFHCPPCHRLNRAFGAGNDRVAVETLVAPKTWSPSEGGFPFVEIFDSVGKSHLLYNVASMEQLEQNIERIESENSQSTEVGSTPVGATIQGRAAIAQFLSTIESIGGTECSIEFKWHREGGKDAFLINKMPTRQEFFGTSGRIEISITTTKKVPIHSVKFDYRFEKGKLFIKPDWIEIEIPEDGVVQSGPQPVGSVLMTAWTVMSIAYDVWQLAHPTVDLWVGCDINATAKYAGGKLSIDTGSNPPAVRLHWAFMMGLLRFELSRALTGATMAAEQCSIQFHKSRLFRDVLIDVK